MKNEKKLKSIVGNLITPKPLIAGRVRTMKSHCGKEGCKCMRKTNPEKHSYNQLSYTKDKRTRTMYVKGADFEVVQEMCGSYAEIRQSTLELGQVMVELSKEHGVSSAGEMMLDAFERCKYESIGRKPEAQKLRETRISRDKWKEKAKKRGLELDRERQRVEQLRKSRGEWKRKSLKRASERNDVELRLVKAEKELKRFRKELFSQKKLRTTKRNSS